MTQPVKSHASGAPPTATRAARRLRGRQPREAEAARHEVQPLRERAATRCREQQPVARAARPGTRATRRRASAAAATALRAAARRVCPPSGGRTARPTGTRPRSRGTARTRPSRAGTRRRSARRACSTARIAAMRPRGDAISRPVTRYVGQCGRHSPHATHATSSSLVETERPSPTSSRRAVRHSGSRPGASLPVGIEGVP